MEGIKSKSLSSFIFIPLLSLIFIRPFVSGLAYPVFEFYYEIAIITIAIIAIIPLIKLRKLPKATYEVKYGWISLLLLAYIISTITSINIHNSIKVTLKFISYISMFFVVSQAEDNQKRAIIKTIVISASIISIYSIYQYFWGYQHTIDYLKRTGNDFLLNSSYAKDILIAKRAIGTFPSPNILGGYLIMVFFLSLTCIQPRRLPSLGAKSQATKPLGTRSATYAVLIVTALVFTKSLGAWLSLIACLIILFRVSYNNFKNKQLIFISSLILVTLVLVLIIINRWERLINLDNPQNSITQRLNYWCTAIAVIKDHPILGVGPGNFQEVFLKYKVGLSTNTRYAHNIFLHQWAETGIIGFTGILLFIISIFKRYKLQNKYIFFACLAFLLHNLIDNSFFIPETGLLWWILCGIINIGMYNWSVDLKKLEKYPEKAVIWKLEQAINFGLNGEKLDKSLVKKHWKNLHIDPARKKFLKFLLWPEKS